MIDPNPKTGRFSLWAVLVVAATVGSAAAGAGWQVGRTKLQDELEQYRRSSEWNLPETLEKMGELSQQLNLKLEDQEKLQQTERIQKEKEELQRKLEDAKKALAASEKRLAEFEGDTFTVQQGKAHSIVPGKLALGVSRINSFADDCTVQFGDKSASLSPGTPLEASMEGVKYRIIFLELDGISCRFSVSRGTAK